MSDEAIVDGGNTEEMKFSKILQIELWNTLTKGRRTRFMGTTLCNDVDKDAAKETDQGFLGTPLTHETNKGT